MLDLTFFTLNLPTGFVLGIRVTGKVLDKANKSLVGWLIVVVHVQG